jgi:hypothetical protein
MGSGRKWIYLALIPFICNCVYEYLQGVAIQLCIVGANGCMCVVLGENGVFQIFYPLV